MNDRTDAPDLAAPLDPNGQFGGYGAFAGPALGGALPVAGASAEAFDAPATASRVAVPRDEGRLLQRLRALCAKNGQDYVYSWEVNDRQNRRRTTIEGPTIKLTNDLARLYGNCVVDLRAFDQAEHILFYARFTDLETGFSLTRPFLQRKSQSLGMGARNADREADIVFQIGASKATRNVVVNALSSFVNFMIEESKKGLLDWVEQHEDGARNAVKKMAEEKDIALRRIEAVVGRPFESWTNRDIAGTLMQLRGVVEGLASADEVYPSMEDADEVLREKQAAATEGKKPAPRKAPAKKAPAKKAKKAGPANDAPPEAEDAPEEAPAVDAGPGPEDFPDEAFDGEEFADDGVDDMFPDD